MSKEQIKTELLKYFTSKYDADRAQIICDKIITGSSKFSLEELKTIGDKWHWANQLFNGKVSSVEFMEKFPK